MTTAPDPQPRFSRRAFLQSASVAAIGGQAAALATPVPARGTMLGTGLHKLELTINGEPRQLEVETRTTLLDALRDGLDLTGTKEICDRGACGGCTVLLDGQPVNACMMLALDAEGHALETIEGLAQGDQLHPVQQAFVACDALQCGFCTPGMVMASVACLRRTPRPTRQQVQEALAGNLCRCGTYGRIFDAVEQAAAVGAGR